MTNRERVKAALSHRQPDRTPYHIHFTMEARRKTAEYLGDRDFHLKLGNCFAGVKPEPPGAWKEVRPGVWRDEWGVEWDRSVDKDIGAVCNQALTKENFDEFPWPDAHDPRRWESWPETLSGFNDKVVMATIGFSLFERVWALYGMENTLIGMAAEGDFIHAVLDRVLDHNLALIKYCCEFPIDALFFGDDWGSQTGIIMGGDLWRQYVKPRVKAMYDAAHERGKYVFIHSCGRVNELFPDLIECGVDLFNPFQPEAMDVFEMKRLHGERLSFFGGISTQKTLPYGTEQDVRDEVRRMLDEVGRDGGYIASPSHAAPADAKPENIVAMIETLNSQ